MGAECGRGWPTLRLLLGIETLTGTDGPQRTKLDVDVTIGVQRPEAVDLDKVKASLPVGNVTMKAVNGGLDVADPENNDPAVIASAAIAVRIEQP